ncbi:MAG TPA: GNAT family N-acetyltransferase [Nitrospira sp.]|nr:GNAT family N-acetyltransferase [Nitrospira sp.]
MQISIRAVEDSDVPYMAAIRAQNWQTEAFWSDRISRYLRGEHSPQKALAARGIFVAIEKEERVGFVAGHRTTRLKCEGELQWIDVRQDRRSLGIGQALVEKMGEWFVGQNTFRICVNVEPTNEPARRLYLKCGAKPLNDHWMIWDDARKMKAAS